MNWKRITNVVSILLLTAFFAWMRSDNLLNRGLMEHDEGHALLNANTWHHILPWGLTGGPLHNDPAALTNLRDELHREGGTLYSAGKFGYSLLVAVVALPTEVNTNLALIMACIAGLLVCVMAGLLAWQYSGIPGAGLVTFVITAFSPLLYYLSREASGTIWALMLAMTGLVCLQWSASFPRRRRWAIGLFAGALFGYAFPCHFNIAPFILASYLAGGLFCVQSWQHDNPSSPPRDKKTLLRLYLKAIIPAAIGSLAVLAVLEVVTEIADYRLRNVFPEYRSMFRELGHLFFSDQLLKFSGTLYGDGVIGWGADAWLFYARALLREGIFVFLIPISLLYTFIFQRHRRARLWAPLILFVIPVLFYAAHTYRVERVLGMCLAAGYILIPVAMDRFLTVNPKVNPWWLMAGVMVVNINNIYTRDYAKALDRLHSPLPAAVDATLTHAQLHGGLITAGSFDTGFAPLWKWAIVEAARRPEHAAARPHIDFSRFDGATIVFTDPATWRRPTTEFPHTQPQVEAATTIIKVENQFPPWTLQSVDLSINHATADAATTPTAAPKTPAPQ